MAEGALGAPVDPGGLSRPMPGGARYPRPGERVTLRIGEAIPTEGMVPGGPGTAQPPDPRRPRRPCHAGGSSMKHAPVRGSFPLASPTFGTSVPLLSDRP